MNSKIPLSLFLLAIMAIATPLTAQETSQPGSDVLLQFDPWGNPTPRGGVTNNGPNSHSIW